MRIETGQEGAKGTMRIIYNGVVALVFGGMFCLRLATMFLMLENLAVIAAMKRPLPEIDWLAESVLTILPLIGLILFTALNPWAPGPLSPRAPEPSHCNRCGLELQDCSISCVGQVDRRIRGTV